MKIKQEEMINFSLFSLKYEFLLAATRHLGIKTFLVMRAINLNGLQFFTKARFIEYQ